VISIYAHVFWSFILLLLSLLAGFFFLLRGVVGQSWYVEVNWLFLTCLDLPISFFFNYQSLFFSATILFIASIVLTYSWFYLGGCFKTNYFSWGTFLFVFTMLLVVRITNLFYLILGWDGLGLISFFLIVYFQRNTAIYSGIFTLLMNRIGDCFLLIRLGLILSAGARFSFIEFQATYPLLAALLAAGLITKSALYPFSSWLPLAIAAPTPISALVHSSTLVTAGLYLILRFSYIFYSNRDILIALLVISTFTSFFAGCSCLFEIDIKKLIALSTLRHLGFMGISFSIGFLDLTLFHMTAHALFKSLLFMAMGDIMVDSSHNQDFRVLSGGRLVTPLSCLIINVSLLNLLGLPIIRGFFSKDLILEALFLREIRGFLYIVVLTNIFFTYFYTYQLFYYSSRTWKGSNLNQGGVRPYFHRLPLMGLLWLRISFGWWALSSITQSPFLSTIPLTIKVFPLTLSLSILLVFYIFTHFRVSSAPFKVVIWYFNRIIFLQFLWSNWMSYRYTWLSFALIKDIEFGFLSRILVDMPIQATKATVYMCLFSAVKSPGFLSLFSSLSFLVLLLLL